jgi:hypothetical protein
MKPFAPVISFVPALAISLFFVLLPLQVDALTAVPEDDLQDGRMFDTSSPRSQKMVSILCFGKDKNFCAKSPLVITAWALTANGRKCLRTT